MVTPEPSEGRLDHPNPEKAEENDIKCNFMKMMEAFKEEMKNSLKEIEEKTNKKLEEINKSLKQVKQTVQDLKTETEAIKKTQTKKILDLESLGK